MVDLRHYARRRYALTDRVDVGGEERLRRSGFRFPLQCVRLTFCDECKPAAVRGQRLVAGFWTPMRRVGVVGKEITGVGSAFPRMAIGEWPFEVPQADTVGHVYVSPLLVCSEDLVLLKISSYTLPASRERRPL